MQSRSQIFITCGLGLAVIAVLALRGPATTAPALGTERIAPDEADVISALRQELTRRDGALREESSVRSVCAPARLHVVDNLDPALAAGVFSAGAQYSATVRFKFDTDSVDLALDAAPLGGDTIPPVDGRVRQNFLFSTRSTRPQAGAKALLAAVQSGRAATQLDPGSLLMFAADTAPPPRDMLNSRWWSALPHGHGAARAAKYSLRPCQRQSSTPPVKQELDAATHLRAQLAQAGACFEFLVQFQTDAAKMPVEDASVDWDQSLSPFQPVALLTLPPGSPALPARSCAALEFSAASYLEAHRPLGGINRARLALARSPVVSR